MYSQQILSKGHFQIIKLFTLKTLMPLTHRPSLGRDDRGQSVTQVFVPSATFAQRSNENVSQGDIHIKSRNSYLRERGSREDYNCSEFRLRPRRARP